MEYVELRDGTYRIGASRVSLGSVVAEFWRGSSPEAIAQCFPVLRLEQVYGAIAFYLANRAEVDARLDEEEAGYQDLRSRQRERDPMFYERLAAARSRAAASS